MLNIINVDCLYEEEAQVPQEMHIRGESELEREIVMKRIVLIYESIYGNTKKVAESIAEGIESVEGLECSVLKVGSIHTDDLTKYNGIIFGCPNHNQEPARNILDFIDRASIVDLEGRKCAVFDTYTGGNQGIAVKKLENTITEELPGLQFIIEGHSAQVKDRKGPLVDGETERGHAFGKEFAQKILSE